MKIIFTINLLVLMKSCFLLLLICFSLKGNKMGRACGMQWRKRKVHIRILRRYLGKRDHLGDPGADRRIILR